MSANNFKSIDRAFQILEPVRKRVRLRDCQKWLTSTVHRLLNSIADIGYIEQNHGQA